MEPWPGGSAQVPRDPLRRREAWLQAFRRRLRRENRDHCGDRLRGQTGRIDHEVDHRSDLYSLGATFYEMLAARPPFDATDPLELVHCHLAKAPLPLHKVIAGKTQARECKVSAPTSRIGNAEARTGGAQAQDPARAPGPRRLCRADEEDQRREGQPARSPRDPRWSLTTV